MYELLNNSNLSWECEKCGMPNFSPTFFNSTIETSNSFLTLDDEEGIHDSGAYNKCRCKNTAGYNVNKSKTS
jgi:hypothetical protein